MSELSTPDIETLRSFVRDQLEPDREKEIYRWLVRCSDPRLPALMESLQIEWEQVQADAELSEAGQRIGELFIDLWQEGGACVDTGAVQREHTERSHDYALRDGSAPDPSEEGIRLRELEDKRPDDRELGICLVAAPGRRRALGVLLTDEEQPNVFSETKLSSATEMRVVGDEQQYVFDRDDGRATFWYVGMNNSESGDVKPDTVEELADWLSASRSDDSKVVRAARLTERYLSDLYE